MTATFESAGTPCSHCGQLFTPRRKTARFCSATCRSQVHRQRMRDNIDKLIAAMPSYTANVIGRARRKDQVQRRMKLVRAANRGDAKAAAELLANEAKP
jgi:hypothetical protein